MATNGDLANGDRGIPFDEFDRGFRKRHNLPACKFAAWKGGAT